MKKLEKHALIIGAIGNIAMAVIAWVAFYFSNSQAVLLDGNYSFITFLGILIALRLTSIKAIRTKTFPLGQYFYEALYGFIRGLMILGVILMAASTAIIRVFYYVSGSAYRIPELIFGPILYYALSVGAICFFLAYYYKIQNKKINHASIILKAEQKAALVDALLSMGVVAVFLTLIIFVREGESHFLSYLADSIFVLLLSFFLIKEPISVIRESVIELASGSLQNEQTRKHFESVINKHKSEKLRLADTVMSKNGSRYMIVLRVESTDGHYHIHDIKHMKTSIENELKQQYEHVFVDVIPHT